MSSRNSVRRVLINVGLMASASAFNLYPLVPAETMSQILGISSGCVSALYVVSFEACFMDIN